MRQSFLCPSILTFELATGLNSPDSPTKPRVSISSMAILKQASQSNTWN